MEELLIRNAQLRDIDTCIDIRGRTRENPINRKTLAGFGVTAESWRQGLTDGRIIGTVCDAINERGISGNPQRKRKESVGFCFAEPESGEILVVAILPEFENKSIGKLLLAITINRLKTLGCRKLWLTTTADEDIRAYGFYRHLGWEPSGKRNTNNDEILTLAVAD